MLFILLLIPTVYYSQLSLTIPRYSIVYTFIEQKTNTNEVFFDHQDKNYQTNYLSQSTSITNNTNTHTFIYQDKITFNTEKKTTTQNKHTNKPPEWDRPSGSSYRRKTLTKTYLSNSEIPLLTNKNGTVTNGLWYDHYTDSYITNKDHLQIDHIVPFAEAFRSHNKIWTRKEVLDFYNARKYPYSLLPVYSNENQLKSDATPKDYLPPNPKFREIYIDLWKQIKKEYNLTISSNEFPTLSQE